MLLSPRIRLLVLPMAAVFLLAAVPGVSWKSYEKGRKVMGDKKRAGLLFFAGEDDFTSQAETNLFEAKAFAGKLKKVVTIRVESGSEKAKELCEEFGVVPGTGAIIILDVQGVKVGRYSQDLDAKGVEEDLQKAVEVSEEKAKVLKPLEKYHKSGKKAYQKKKYAAALKSFHLVLQIQEQKGELVPSPLYDEAETAVEEIRAIARKQLIEGNKLAEDKKYGKAGSIARSVQQQFPDEQIDLEVKALLELIERKQLEDYRGGAGR